MPPPAAILIAVPAEPTTFYKAHKSDQEMTALEMDSWKRSFSFLVSNFPRKNEKTLQYYFPFCHPC
jgi:hypothetical protein